MSTYRERTSSSPIRRAGCSSRTLLRDYAGIKRDVMFTGDVDKFRIWDTQVWQEAFQAHEDSVLGDEKFLASLDV